MAACSEEYTLDEEDVWERKRLQQEASPRRAAFGKTGIWTELKAHFK